MDALRAWNEEYGRLALSDVTWPSPEHEIVWRSTGSHLAHALQNALPDVEVHYVHDRTRRPLR